MCYFRDVLLRIKPIHTELCKRASNFLPTPPINSKLYTHTSCFSHRFQAKRLKVTSENSSWSKVKWNQAPQNRIKNEWKQCLIYDAVIQNKRSPSFIILGRKVTGITVKWAGGVTAAGRGCRKWLQKKSNCCQVEKTSFLAASQSENSCQFHAKLQDFQVQSSLISVLFTLRHFKNTTEVKTRIILHILTVQLALSGRQCCKHECWRLRASGEAPPCLDGECSDCSRMDFGWSAARLSLQIHSQQQHKCVQWVRSGFTQHVCVCVCQPCPVKLLFSFRPLEKTNCLTLW